MWKQHGHLEVVEVSGCCAGHRESHSLLSFSEEIFDFSAEQMTQLKAATLKTQMKSEFAEIYNLCREVLDKAVKPSLIKATLETLLRFVNWVPVGYIFETDLIETLRNKVKACSRTTAITAYSRFFSL